LAHIKKPWNSLGHSAVVDTHQSAQRALDKPGRNKYKCVHYDPETCLCEMNNIGCVGPSNSLCPDYCTNPGLAKEPPNRTYSSRRSVPVHPPKPKQTIQPKPQPKSAKPPKPTFDYSSVSIGMSVKHMNAGKGKITKIDPAKKTVTVRIAGDEIVFPFPDSFINGYLTLLAQDNDPK